jgi:penicillin-binding protein 1C
VKHVASIVATAVSHFLIATVMLAAMVEIGVRLVQMPPLDRLEQNGQLVLALDGKPLTGFLSADEKWRFPVSVDDVDPVYRAMLLAYEDRNFTHHRGVDFAALLRAAWQAARHGRVVSGASTLTMQVVRLLERHPRTVAGKLLEMAQALKFERRYGKEAALRAYFSVAPFGGNIEGVRAASLLYFGKEPVRLSGAEAALLVAVPQAPEARRPDRFPDAAKLGRNRVLDAALRQDVIEKVNAAAAAGQPVRVTEPVMPQHAPHLARQLRERGAGDAQGTIHTLVDRRLQLDVETVARNALRGWGEAVNIAIVVMRNQDGAIVAHVGSGEPGAPARNGFVDMARAVRSPGSTLKPFIYALAFEQLLVHPDTIVADQPVDFNGYRPSNADSVYSGDLSIRQSLVLSKNTVPVMLLDRIGPAAFLSRFRSVGSPLRLGVTDREAGLAVALGGVGVTLEQLVWFYSAIASEGQLQRPRWTSRDPRVTLGHLFRPDAAIAVAEILADTAPPAGWARMSARDGTLRLGFKTGTSYGFRDAWAVGFDKLHTVGIWIGRPDGAPHLGAYGVTAAAPLLMQVFDRLPVPRGGASSARHSRGALASPRALPERLRRFGPAHARSMPDDTLAIVFPRRNSQIAAAQYGAVTLPLRAAGGRPPYRWSVKGRDEAQQLGAEHWAAIDVRGAIEIKVTDADGRVAASSFWLE